MPQWLQGVMPPMLYPASADSYGCPPGALMVAPFPYMMDQSGQLFQFPYPMNQSQLGSWAPSSNKFHMSSLHEGDISQNAVDSDPSKDVSQVAAEIDVPSSTHKVETKDISENVGDFNVSAVDSLSLPDDIIALGNPRQMLVNTRLASSVVDLLEGSDNAKRESIITWVQPAVLDLALSANGTRVIQKALELSGRDAQIKLSLCLHGRVRKLLDSHHGNHVLQKSIVVMPPHAVQFIFHELSFYRQGWASVVCHRFGCRVVERLLEHCDAALTAPIVAAVVAEIDSLSRHPFANYVVQHILEYVPAHRYQVVHGLIQVGALELAQHRVASNIIERVFEHCNPENQQALAQSILATEYAIVEMGCSRYGSFTVRRMLDVLQDPLRYMALQQLAAAIPSLRASKHGRHIAARVSAALSSIEGTSA